jgi:hypothetical protein
MLFKIRKNTQKIKNQNDLDQNQNHRQDDLNHDLNHFRFKSPLIFEHWSDGSSDFRWISQGSSPFVAPSLLRLLWFLICSGQRPSSVIAGFSKIFLLSSVKVHPLNHQVNWALISLSLSLNPQFFAVCSSRVWHASKDSPWVTALHGLHSPRLQP